MNLQTKYRQFFREKLEKEELYKYGNLVVLGENILENIYFAICEEHLSSDIQRYIFIIDKNKIHKFNIKISKHNDKYVRCTKKSLCKNLGEKYYGIFVRNGLARSEEVGWKLNNYCCFHRLVLALYTSMLNRDTHHLNEIRNENPITNLVPIDTIFHETMHKNFDAEWYKELLQQEFVYNLKHPKKQKRQTVASNEYIILQLLSLKESGYTVKKIYKDLKHKISERAIYNILNKFHSYRKEFLEWLEMQERTPSLELDAESHSRWFEILIFDRLLDKSEDFKSHAGEPIISRV